MKNLEELQHKEIFLYGFYVTFIALSSLAFIVDFAIKNYQDSIIDIVGVTVASLAFYILFLKKRDYDLSSVAIFWITTGVVFLFIIENDFDISIIFTLLVPLVGFILMSATKAKVHITIYFILLATIFIYGYSIYLEHPLLYNPKHMSAYIIALLFVIAFGVVYQIVIESSYQKLKLANRQKTFLLKEIHHRVKNNLNIISSIWGIQKLESNSKEVHDLIDQNRLRLESMAMAHEVLYQHDRIDNIDFKSYISKLATHILNVESQKGRVNLNIDITPLSLNIEKMIQFGMMVNELITNSIKYAFKEETGSIYISLKSSNKGYIFRYCDSGEGASLSSVKKGFGYSLIEMAIEQLDGELSITNSSGLCYIITFKELKDESTNS